MTFRLKRPEPKEAQVLSAVLRVLELHPKVAWAERMNTGSGLLSRRGGKATQWVNFGFKGLSDVIGQTVDGRFLAVETKRPSGKATAAQEAFLETVRRHGGVAVVAKRVEDVLEALA